MGSRRSTRGYPIMTYDEPPNHVFKPVETTKSKEDSSSLQSGPDTVPGTTQLLVDRLDKMVATPNKGPKFELGLTKPDGSFDWKKNLNYIHKSDPLHRRLRDEWGWEYHLPPHLDPTHLEYTPPKPTISKPTIGGRKYGTKKRRNKKSKKSKKRRNKKSKRNTRKK